LPVAVKDEGFRDLASVDHMRRIFGRKRNEVTGGWRKPQNELLHDLYTSPSIIRIMKSRKMRCAEHVAKIGEKRNAYRLLVG
jgi:hypothetical protein